MWALILFQITFATPKIPAFTDKDLERGIQRTSKNEQKGIIYTWSPHMTLSVHGLKEMIVFAKQNKISLSVILDPDANEDVAIQILKSHNWPVYYLRRLQSEKLLNMGARVHYPSYVIVANGQISSPLIPGHKTTHQIQTYLKKFGNKK